jgi:hypothetical protein|tara:strand:- start:12236 stop:13210 length:975 start_codon:yes stop_codon:yes gene_type:complete
MRILTFDIGGANIKRIIYDSKSQYFKSDIFYFPIWKKKDELFEFLRLKSSSANVVGVTMTAEISDTFFDNISGIMYIIDACENSFNNPLYLTINGEFVKKEDISDPLELGASNWIASKYYVEKKYTKGILLDVGSTTSDIIPFGTEIKIGKKDLERLINGQLVYTGFLRTPLSSVVKSVPYRRSLIRISTELFAITADVYNVLGMLENYSCDTPDGKGKSKIDSMRRISRHLCASLNDIKEEHILKICEYIYQVQQEDLANAISEVVKGYSFKNAYVCGIGAKLGVRACEQVGLNTHNLSGIIDGYDNLPCLGMVEMLMDFGKV